MNRVDECSRAVESEPRIRAGVVRVRVKYKATGLFKADRPIHNHNPNTIGGGDHTCP